MPVFIALLRAVNVGGTGKLPMKELKTACEDAGLRRVTTYLASGNVIFETDASAAATSELIALILRDRFDLATCDVILRQPDDLATIIAGNPFPEAARERPNLLIVLFLAGKAAQGATGALATYQGPERLHLDGRHLYIDYADGIARSKLTAAFLARALGTAATGRNWSTCTKLYDLAHKLTP